MITIKKDISLNSFLQLYGYNIVPNVADNADSWAYSPFWFRRNDILLEVYNFDHVSPEVIAIVEQTRNKQKK